MNVITNPKTGMKISAKGAFRHLCWTGKGVPGRSVKDGDLLKKPMPIHLLIRRFLAGHLRWIDDDSAEVEAKKDELLEKLRGMTFTIELMPKILKHAIERGEVIMSPLTMATRLELDEQKTKTFFTNHKDKLVVHLVDDFGFNQSDSVDVGNGRMVDVYVLD